MKFEPRYRKIIREKKENGKLKTLSQKSTYNLDNKLAMALKPIQEEFYKKEKASRNYINKLESISNCNQW